MVQQPGKDPIMFPTGTLLSNMPDVVHGGFKVVGDTVFEGILRLRRRSQQAALRVGEVVQAHGNFACLDACYAKSFGCLRISSGARTTDGDETELMVAVAECRPAASAAGPV